MSKKSMTENQTPETNKEASDEFIIDRLARRAAQKGRHSSEKDNLSSALKLAYVFIGILVVINIFMAFALLNVYKDRSVSIKIPPATLKDVDLVFGSTRVSKPVYRVYADYIVRRMSNVNYHNVTDAFKDVIGYCAADKYYEISKVFSAQANHIKSNLVSQRFELQDIKLTPQKNGLVIAECSGFASRTVGGKEAFKNLPYQFKLYLSTYMGNVIVQGVRSGLNKNTRDIGKQRRVEQYEKDNRYINF
jgi:hypothetical protein